MTLKRAHPRLRIPHRLHQLRRPDFRDGAQLERDWHARARHEFKHEQLPVQPRPLPQQHELIEPVLVVLIVFISIVIGVGTRVGCMHTGMTIIRTLMGRPLAEEEAVKVAAMELKFGGAEEALMLKEVDDFLS